MGASTQACYKTYNRNNNCVFGSNMRNTFSLCSMLCHKPGTEDLCFVLNTKTFKTSFQRHLSKAKRHIKSENRFGYLSENRFGYLNRYPKCHI